MRNTSDDDAVAVAHRRASIWFIGLVTIILMCWWLHPFALPMLLLLVGLMLPARLLTYVVCRIGPQWLGFLIIVGSIAFVSPLVVMSLI